MQFRNIEVDPSSPTDQLGFEAVLAMIERGGIVQWGRLVRAIEAEPFGKVATEVAAPPCSAR